MAKPRRDIEARFRQGSNFFILIGVFSALCHTLLYWGFNILGVKVFCLAVPVVLDTVVRAMPPRLWGDELHYYSFLAGLAFSALFLLLGLASKFTSHSGTFLKLTRYFKSLSGLARWGGITNLIGSRLFYLLGLILYLADGIAALALENALSAKFSDLRLVILGNLAFHCLMLVFLLPGFVAGFEAESKPLPSRDGA